MSNIRFYCVALALLRVDSSKYNFVTLLFMNRNIVAMVVGDP